MADPAEAGTVRLVLVGDTLVGKSSILLRLCEDRFESNYVVTIGVEYKERILTIDGRPIRLQVWDTAGQERFRTITPAYYRRALGALIVFDLTNKKSFENVEDWLKSLSDHGDPTVQKVLVGNKVDLPASKRKVSKEAATQLAQRHNMEYFEVSAKEDICVEKVFEWVTKKIAETHTLTGLPVRLQDRMSERNSENSSNKCC